MFSLIQKILKRNLNGYSLIETMTIIAVLGIVAGLLYAYSDQGWNLFYQSYGRGLSQVKAKLAIRILADDLREANKNRIAISTGGSYGVPVPDGAEVNSGFIYFTKPRFYESTGDIIGYDYVLYYFAKPKEKFDNVKIKTKEKKKFLILKSIKFINQSKNYTEDSEKPWPFLPPLLELQKSRLPEDDEYIESLKEKAALTVQESSSSSSSGSPTKQKSPIGTNTGQFLDYFSRLKIDTRNIPVSGNFSASALTEPFTIEQVNIFFGQDYKSNKPIKIKVSLEEPTSLFGAKSTMSEFEVTITPRN